MFSKIKEKATSKAEILFNAVDLNSNNYIDPIE